MNEFESISIREAAARITEMHLQLQHEAERVAWNNAIDRAQEIVSEWIANGRDETALFDRLQDLKIWTR